MRNSTDGLRFDMDAVNSGGLATNIGIGADLGGWEHHTAEFGNEGRSLEAG